MKKITILIYSLTLATTLGFAQTGQTLKVDNERIAELAAGFFEGFTLQLTDVTVIESDESTANLTANVDLITPGYSYQAYLTYLQSLYELIDEGAHDYEFNLRMKYKDFPDDDSRTREVPMLGVENDFIGSKYLDYFPGNDKCDMTMKDSLFTMTESLIDGSTRDYELSGTIGSLSDLNCYKNGERANFLELFENGQPLFFDFKSEFPRVTFIVRHTESIRDVKSITISFDANKNLQLMKAWDRNPELSDKALITMAELGEGFTSDTAVADRAIAKLKTRASRPNLFLVLALSNVPITFLIGLIVFSIKKRRRYKNVDPKKETLQLGARNRDVSMFVLTSSVILIILYIAGLGIYGFASSKVDNLSREDLYKMYQNEVSMFSGQALDSLLQSGGSIDTSKNTVAESIPYELFTDEIATLYRKILTQVPRAGTIGGIIIILYLIVNLVLYVMFSNAPAEIIAIRQQCLGRSGKFGDVVRIMIQCAKEQKLPTYYNIVTTYQNGGVISTRREYDAGMNLLTTAFFKVMLPMCIVVASAFVAAFWGFFLAMDAKYRNFDRPDLEYRYWITRMQGNTNSR